LLDRIASHRFSLVFGNWITSTENPRTCNTSEVSRRDDVESRYSMAAGIPMEANRRIATEAIAVGIGLTLHKYKPTVTDTIPTLSRRRRSSVNTSRGSDTRILVVYKVFPNSYPSFVIQQSPAKFNSRLIFSLKKFH